METHTQTVLQIFMTLCQTKCQDFNPCPALGIQSQNIQKAGLVTDKTLSDVFQTN